MASCSDTPAAESPLTRLQALYQAYYDASWELQGCRPPEKKLFGIGTTAKINPCHKQFAADVAALVEDMVQEHAPQEDAEAVLRYMLEEPEHKQDDQMVYWMLLAVHGSAAPLCDLISVPTAAELLGTYDRLYPRRMRSPVQKQFYKALHTRAKG